VVEGPIIAALQNMRQRRFDIAQHFSRRNSQYLKPKIRKYRVSPDVPFRQIATTVNLAVHLNCNSPLEAGEIEDVAFVRELPAESQSARSSAQLPPEEHLRKGHVAAKLASETDTTFVSAYCSMADACGVDPSTMLRMVPLPVPGRILR
jgi:hypothetical protein